MLSLSPATRIYVVTGPTDMRKAFNGLTAIVRNHLGRDPLSGHLFVFCNRRRDRLKVLYWDQSGLWVCAKRLEKGTFAWPQNGTRELQLTNHELALLLGGLDLKQTKQRPWFRRSASRASRTKN